ncbi:hypothetical protein GOP47_0028628 [Adiantum capillus-veneris]|nr:hypothetical protein GOP47_0028628 [Adiantum capillus-veneris]
MAVSGDNSSSSLHSVPEHSEPFSSCLAQEFAKTEPPAPCDSFLQPLHHPFLPDFTDPPAFQECWDSAHPANVHLLVPSGPVPGGSANGDRLSARRLHKADREKLRRDKLNEQFTELASALDPDRPKNDKATILGESVQVVKDLRDEVKRLKTEHASLLDESRDLTQEKNELREEKAALKNETEQLQSQIQQRLRASSPWMAMDPSMMMSATAFPYPLPVQQPISAPQTDSHPRPLLTPAPFMPLAPPLSAYHMHPNLQAFPVFGNRPGDVGGNPYMHYAAFTGQPISSHSHVERPYAQYPSAVQPMPGYVVQIAPSPGSESQPSSRSSSAYKACVPGIPVVPASPTHGQSKSGSHHPSPSESSSQHTLSESKQDISSAAERHACSLESLGPSRLLAASNNLKSDDSGSCQVEAAACATASMCVGEGRLVDTSTDQVTLPCPVEVVEIDGDSAHDPTLRPPAA